MKRRDLLKSGALLAASSALGGCAVGAGTPEVTRQAPAKLAPTNIFIPGYKPEKAFYKGRRALDDAHMRRAIPRHYDGPVRMLTRINADGAVKQALFPVHGHDVGISADGRTGFFGAMEGTDYVTFDPRTLDLVAMGRPVRKGWIGGGHGAFLKGRNVLALTERAPKRPYTGHPSDHYGRVSLRDPRSLKVLGDFSTHGISPHEIRMLEDGTHAVIANYGSVVPPGKSDYGNHRDVIEPSVTVVEIASGKLVAKYRGMRKKELRHLCARDAETIFAIQTELANAGEDQRYFRGAPTAYEADLTAGDTSYLVAPTLRLDPRAGRLRALGSARQQAHMRHGLSIKYDPKFNEVIASYPSTNTVMIYDADSGRIKQQVDCAAIGLRYPCGVALLPGQDFYAVAGYWQNLFIFERGTHVLHRELSHSPMLFGHSHMVAV